MKTKVLPHSVKRLFTGYIGLLVAAGAQAALPTHAEIKSAFDALDPSRNGAIGIAEWRADDDPLFWRLDVDGDGFLTRAEVPDNALMLDQIYKAYRWLIGFDMLNHNR